MRHQGWVQTDILSFYRLGVGVEQREFTAHHVCLGLLAILVLRRQGRMILLACHPDSLTQLSSRPVKDPVYGWGIHMTNGTSASKLGENKTAAPRPQGLEVGVVVQGTQLKN